MSSDNSSSRPEWYVELLWQSYHKICRSQNGSFISGKMRRTTRPEWHEAMTSQSFHGICRRHEKQFVDFFCFYCHCVGCCECYTLHSPNHPIIQVFDLLEHDAVRLDCISNFVDCSEIQTRDFEGEKLVVLKPKNHDYEGEEKAGLKPKYQVKCGRICKKLVREPFKFCSIACKVNHLSAHEEDLTQLFKIDTFSVNLSDINDRFAPKRPRRSVRSKGRKSPQRSQGLALPVEYNDQNTLVERCARQPGPECSTSQGLTLPTVEHNDQIALDERCPEQPGSEYISQATEEDRAKDEPQKLEDEEGDKMSE